MFMNASTHLVHVYEDLYSPCPCLWIWVYSLYSVHYVYPLGGVGDQEPGREREDVGHQPQGGGGS